MRLRVEVDQEHTQIQTTKRCGQIDRETCLPNAAFFEREGIAACVGSFMIYAMVASQRQARLEV